MKNIVPIIFVFFQFSVCGQMGTVSPIAAGLGNASVAMQSPVALFGNQAGLTSLTKVAFGAAAEQRFSVSELQSVALAAALPTKSGTFGLQLHSFGFEGYRQHKIGLSYARKLWAALSIGAQFDFFQTRIPEYGSSGAFTFEAGMQAKVSKALTIGAHVFSPAQVELAEGENLPSIFKIGIAWQVSDKLIFCSEVEKDLDYKPRWKNGLSYQPVKQLSLRTGYAVEPSMLYFGVGFAFSNGLQTDMAGSFHPTLGFSPSAGVVWNKI